MDEVKPVARVPGLGECRCRDRARRQDALVSCHLHLFHGAVELKFIMTNFDRRGWATRWMSMGPNRTNRAASQIRILLAA